ncbi:glycosyltransferase family 4 protein [Planctomycetota bacterium]
MRILLVHNYYGDGATGGEDAVMNREAELLCAHGHEVATFCRKNSEFVHRGAFYKLAHCRDVIWSAASYRMVQSEIAAFRPDVMHVHNCWMVLTPSIFRAAKEMGVATVLTLHNYRLACLASQCLRHGKLCEVCIGRNPWRIIPYRCYQGSLLGSVAKYCMWMAARKKNVWRNDVDAFIALTGFAKQKFVAGGLEPAKIHVKSNFMEDPLQASGFVPPGKGAIMLGRLSPEKGVHTLLEAWRGIDVPLKIVGDGPLRRELERMAPGNVEFVGHVPQNRAFELLLASAFVVFPSEWYEGFPLALLEALAAGRAVVATDLGARSEMVLPAKTGLLYESGNAADLRAKVGELTQSPGGTRQMGRKAREHFLSNYTAERNYDTLVEIYQAALKRSAPRPQPSLDK